MSTNETEKAGFEKAMKKGKIYKVKVQQEIAKYATGRVESDVRIDNVCDFDIVIRDFPVLSFVEIKFYRGNLIPDRVRSATLQFRNRCKHVTEEESGWKRNWIPYFPQLDPDSPTNKDVFFKKLSLSTPECWRYRMILIVPNKSIDAVLGSLNGTKFLVPEKYEKYLRLVDGIPLLVVSEKRINEVFG